MGSPNALPVFRAIERKLFSLVANGHSLPMKFYLGLQEENPDSDSDLAATNGCDETVSTDMMDRSMPLYDSESTGMDLNMIE